MTEIEKEAGGSQAGLNTRQRYLFDTRGYIVIQVASALKRWRN